MRSDLLSQWIHLILASTQVLFPKYTIILFFDGKDGEAILHRKDFMGISISTGSICDSKNTEFRHFGCLKVLPRGTVRVPLGKDNTREDVDEIVLSLRKYEL